jgi:putative endonuclease
MPEQSDQSGNEVKPHPLSPHLSRLWRDFQLAKERGRGGEVIAMEKYRQKFGKQGEALAEEYLKRKGFAILEKNYRYGHKEIDLIGKDGNTIVFIEVKTGRSTKFGTPEWWVSIRKQKNLIEAASDFIQKRNITDCDFRFDVLAITYKEREVNIEHIKNAFMVT